MKKLLAIGMLFNMLLISGCVYYPSPSANNITISSDREVAECKLLGQVYGDSGKLLFSSAGVQVARDQVKDKAFRIGATHISILEENVRVNPYVLARAYRCDFGSQK